MPLLFIGNGPYANRGCEAIAKSTISILREFLPASPITNISPGGDYDQADESEPDVRHIRCAFFPERFSRMALSGMIYDKTRVAIDLSKAGKMVTENAPGKSAAFGLGGDLYGLSMGKHTLMQYYFAGEAAMRQGVPLFIWGATIGRMDAEPHLKSKLMDHFKRCNLVFVREQDSFDYLAENGVTHNVRLIADPAFLLKSEPPAFDLKLPEPLAETIGFNLVAAYRGALGYGQREMVKLGADCVEAIVRATGRHVLLVPHVVAYPIDSCPDNDTVYLTLVREALLERGICVSLLPSNLRCWQIKWVVGQLKVYVGARFHSTVAAFGSGTPVLAIPYSEKGPALSKFLINTTDYVINCRDLAPGILAEKLASLLDNENDVRAILGARLPEVRRLALSAGRYVAESLGVKTPEADVR